METARLIKKYPNRRLYDTSASRYITLEEIRNLVLEHVRLQVIDARSGEDLTNQILLQVISSQEAGQAPFLTTEILQGIIRFHNHPMQQSIREFIEKAFAFYTAHQADFAQHLKNFATPGNPLSDIQKMAQKNMDFWQSFFDPNKKP